MNIGIVTPYKKYNGGVEIVTRQLEKLLVEQGHTVVWLTLDEYKVTKIEGILIKFFSQAYITRKLYSKKVKEYDLVICNGEFGYGIKHPKCINIFHGSYLGILGSLNKQLSFKSKITYSILAHIQVLSSKKKSVVAVSQFVSNILTKQSIKVDRVIPNSVDIDQFRPLKKDRNGKYLFVGGYNYYAKGFDILLELSKMGINIDCITNKKPPGSLGWLGEIPNDQLPLIYNQYNGLIFPSRFEASGMVVLEAMACGLPVIMFNVGVGSEIRSDIPEFVIDNSEDRVIEEFIERTHIIEKDFDNYSQIARSCVEKKFSYESFKANWINYLSYVSQG